MMHGGQAAPSLNQLQEIVATAPQMAHTTLIALEWNCQGYSMLLDVLLGTNHCVLLHFCSSVEAFQTMKVKVKEQFGTEIHAGLPLIW